MEVAAGGGRRGVPPFSSIPVECAAESIFSDPHAEDATHTTPRSTVARQDFSD